MINLPGMLVEKEASKQGIKKASEESRKVKKPGIKEAKNQGSKQADRFIVTYKTPTKLQFLGSTITLDIASIIESVWISEKRRNLTK